MYMMKTQVKKTTETEISLNYKDLMLFLTTPAYRTDIPDHARILFPFPPEYSANDVNDQYPITVMWTTQTTEET